MKYSEHTSNIVVDETYDKINWRGEGGTINEHTIFVFQGYSGVESDPNIPLKEIEIYEQYLTNILVKQHKLLLTNEKDINL